MAIFWFAWTVDGSLYDFYQLFGALTLLVGQ